jgi:hypothetical protein
MVRTIHYLPYLAKLARRSSTLLVYIAGLVRVITPHVLCVETSSEITVVRNREVMAGRFLLNDTSIRHH